MSRYADRGKSFGTVAGAYARSRPGYPPEAVAWLTGDCPAHVLDLGAGTGKMTSALAASGHEVVAVDPSQPMLAELRVSLPQVRARIGTAEAIPADDDIFDIVVVAQAFHWFDQKTALPEIARVIRPGGWLALAWNLHDVSVPWVHDLWAAIAPDEAASLEGLPLRFESPFGPTEHATFDQCQQLDRNAMLALVRSRSYVAVQSAKRQNELLGAAEEIFDRYADVDHLVLPYVTHCYRIPRLG